MSLFEAWRVRRLVTMSPVAFCKRLRWHGFEHVHTARAVAPALLWLVASQGVPTLALRALALYCPPVRGTDERGAVVPLTANDVTATLRTGHDVALSLGGEMAGLGGDPIERTALELARHAEVVIVPVVARLDPGGGLDVRIGVPVDPRTPGEQAEARLVEALSSIG